MFILQCKSLLFYLGRTFASWKNLLLTSYQGPPSFSVLYWNISGARSSFLPWTVHCTIWDSPWKVMVTVVLYWEGTSLFFLSSDINSYFLDSCINSQHFSQESFLISEYSWHISWKSVFSFVSLFNFVFCSYLSFFPQNLFLS